MCVTFSFFIRLLYREPQMKQIDFRQDLLPLKDKIYRMGLRITLNAQEAEDLTQETLIRAWNKREELTNVSNIEAFCIAICRNLALDVIARKEQSNLSIENEQTDVFDSSRTPEEQLEHDDKLSKIHHIFNELPERLRTAVQLRDIEGMSYAEAAMAMNITEDLFKVTLHRARKAIKVQYEKLDNYGL